MNFGSFCHVEFPGTDLEKQKKFFTSVFGWKFDSSMPGYETYTTGDPQTCIGGGLWTPPEGMPRVIVNYILVPSVDAHSKKIVDAGGTIYKEKTEVPGMGWFAVFGDPEGNTWGIWETNPEHMKKWLAEQEAKKKAAQPKAKAKPAKKKAAPKAKAKPAKKAAPKAKAKAKPAKKAAKPAKKAAPKAKAKAKPAKKKKR